MIKQIAFGIALLFSQLITAQSTMSSQKIHTMRLHPGDDLKTKLTEYVFQHKIQAGYIITCVGSLKQATLRLANRNETQTWKEQFEITSLVGTLSPDGNHLHITIADKDGKTIGGHFVEGTIFTTAEIVIGEATDLSFKREYDSLTTHKELIIHPITK